MDSPPPCGWSAIAHPLANSSENAFNPCFLAAAVLLLATLFAVLASAQLHLLLHSSPHGSPWPKSTGLTHHVRCFLVVLHSLCMARLLWAVTLTERFADSKVIGFGALVAVHFALIIPLHVIETARSPVPSGVLLVFWPLMAIVDFALWYQDSFTNWPVFLLESGSAFEFVALVSAVAILAMESSRYFWKPTHELSLYHIKNGSANVLRSPNILQRMTFSWMNPLVKNSYVNQTVAYDDLPEAPAHLTTAAYTRRLEKYWKGHSNHGLGSAIAKAFFPLAIVSFLYEAGDSLLSLLQPQLLRHLILFMAHKVDNPGHPILDGILICLAMFSVTIIQTAFNNQYVLKVLEVGLGCRSSLTSLIFQKVLRLSANSRSERSSGDIINLVSIDAPRVQTCAQEISTIIIAPTEIFLSIWSLYSLLGKSAFAGLVVMILFVPINITFMRFQKRLSKLQMRLKDSRNRVTNEILVGMKSIKLYAWEGPMLERLFEARNEKELKNARKIRMFGQVGNLIWVTMPFLVSFSTFASFAVLEETPLTSDIVFPALALLNILSRPISTLPAVVTYIIEASIALDRIADFLLSPEVRQELFSMGSNRDNHAVKLDKMSFVWSKPEQTVVSEDMDFAPHKYALQNVSLSVARGDFVCLVGKVGSGKSSLLSSLLGQIEALDAEDAFANNPAIQINGSVAYCSQNPWIMNASVKDNILFGHEYDEYYYNKTVEACQLIADLKILPDGDDTQVGEKGISLSGGQKARLSLARAIYSRADIYLLDDILSAVDSHVGKNIIGTVLSESGLLANKTLIFATNNLRVLEYSNKIYLFERGVISEEATFDEILSTSSFPKLSQLLDESGNSKAKSMSPSPADSESTTPDVKLLNYQGATLAPFVWDGLKKNIAKRTGPTVEVSAKGQVKWKVYREYIEACSKVGIVMWLVLYAGATAVSIATNYWLKNWSERNSEIGNNSQALYFIAIFASLGFATSLLSLLKGLLFWVHLSIKGGRNIHDKMAKRLMKAPMAFFERTPVGRIMNRFSNDINKVDDALPRSLNILIGTLLKTFATIIIVTIALPYFSVVVVFMAFIFGYYQRYYISVQREMKRLVSVSRSPIFAHIQESLTGVETIKAYRQESRFTSINNANVDFNMRSLFMLRSINRWLSVRLQFIGSLVIWTSSSLIIYKSTTSSPISAGMAGFVMSYALQVTDTLKSTVRMSAEVESNVVSVERCLEYCNLPTEEDDVAYEAPPENWPGQGQITLENYSTRYAKDLDLVLKNVNLSIQSGEKVGVVGRTGAGKSSLVLAIFRMIPAAEGTIVIDEIDTSKLSLFDLRHRLSIIPQDSHLFEGSIRQNLDPFNEHSDERLWEVLSHSKLKETVMELDEGLESKVQEGGTNFSVGQRQLMCLGRALLNDSKILLLDEATAAVDLQTDKIIQKTIRSEFKDKTIVTIAHRLDTVMDSDRILSLDHGEVREFDKPANLLSNKDGIFYNLCQQGNYVT